MPGHSASYSKVSELSGFVLGLTEQARTRGASSLVAWAVSELADILGFDCAWYGWAQLHPEHTVIHANGIYNLPSNYYEFWTGIAHQDVLVEQFLENPKSVPTYERFAGTQTDGMETLADNFGLNKMATAMCQRDGRTASFYISAYRSGAHALSWGRGDREFLQCAVDNISSVAQVAAANDLASPDGQTTSAFLSHKGAMIVGLANMRERFGHLWSRSDGDRVPRWLADYASRPGEHVLPDEELVVTCEPVRDAAGLDWKKLSLRPLRKFDLLSPREREVARALANGQSHKSTARLLGVAPATVRNQTQAIYRKLGVDNRASLARQVFPKLT